MQQFADTLGTDPTNDRRSYPIFVMGCHRSGTNLLYDTLLSAGGFAVYRGYLPVYKMLIPRFGDLRKIENRQKLMRTWLRSKGFRRSGLNPEEFTRCVLNDCRTGGDFIRITMDQIAWNQKAIRWAVYDPDNVLYMPNIKKDIPEALFIHIIRDGRDIALSLKKMGGFQPLPWDSTSRGLQATALYWEWMVRNGRQHGREFPADYVEIRYEDLVSEPRTTLATLGKFLQHDLDYSRIQTAALGSLRESNSSFREELLQTLQSPINRWKQRLSPSEIARIEALVGNCLQEFGYPLALPEHERKPGLREMWMRACYFSYLDSKLWLKLRTPAGRLTDISALELIESVPEPESVSS